MELVQENFKCLDDDELYNVCAGGGMAVVGNVLKIIGGVGLIVVGIVLIASPETTGASVFAGIGLAASGLAAIIDGVTGLGQCLKG